MGLLKSIVKGIGKVAAPVLKIGSTVAGLAGKDKLSDALGAFGDVATGERQRTDTLDLQNQAMSFQREMNEAQQKFNSAEAEKTRAFNSEEAAKQRQFEQQMYEQQTKDNREWNDIGAQLQRQMAAGLNPLGMDGETMSLGNPGTGAAANGGSPASIHPNGAPAIANPSIGIANQMADLRLKNAQAEAAEDANQRENEKQPYVIETMKGNIYLIGTSAELNKTTKQSLEAQMPLYQSELEQINETIQSIKLDNDKRRKVLANWQREFDANMRNIEADTGYKLSLTDKSRAEINKIFSETTAIDQQNVINSVEFEVAKNNHSALVQLRYNKEKQEYDVYIENAKADKADARAREAKAKADAGYYDFINGDSWMGAVHEGLYDFGRAIGFSAGVSLPIKK